jgi:hypothetical protein
MPKTDYSIITEEQAQLVEMLSKGMKMQEIADVLGVHINTVTNRKKSPIVQSALKEVRKEAVRMAQNLMGNKATWAAQKIIDMVDDPDATRVQYQAACKVYDAGIGITVEDFEERLEKLEESVTREV